MPDVAYRNAGELRLTAEKRLRAHTRRPDDDWQCECCNMWPCVEREAWDKVISILNTSRDPAYPFSLAMIKDPTWRHA